MCRKVARETGILLDPIYTLAGWECAQKLVVDNRQHSILVVDGDVQTGEGVRMDGDGDGDGSQGMGSGVVGTVVDRLHVNRDTRMSKNTQSESSRISQGVDIKNVLGIGKKLGFELEENKVACDIGEESAVRKGLKNSEVVVMLHTGGTLGLFGLAQRYPREFVIK